MIGTRQSLPNRVGMRDWAACASGG